MFRSLVAPRAAVGDETELDGVAGDESPGGTVVGVLKPPFLRRAATKLDDQVWPLPL